MEPSIENELYNQYGIAVPIELFENHFLLEKLWTEVRQVVPAEDFISQHNFIKYRGYPWLVEPANTEKGYELIPPREHYVVNLIKKAGVDVPERAYMQGGNLAIDFQWDIFKESPWLRLFDVSIAGKMANKIRFERDDSKQGLFQPQSFGVNLNYTSGYTPARVRTVIPYPRLIYDFQERCLHQQWSPLPADVQSGKFEIGNGGQQITIGRSFPHEVIPSLFLNIDHEGDTFRISATSGDNIMYLYLSTLTCVEDSPFVNPEDFSSMNKWVENMSSIVVPTY